MKHHARFVFASTALACGGLLGYAYYLEIYAHLEPCPMCIFQRLCYAAIMVIALSGAAHAPRRVGVYVYSGFILVAAAIGTAIAARQVWLQHLPADRVPACGPGLEYMLEALPLAEVIKNALRGTGECALVEWTLLGLSMAEWSLGCFAACAIAYLVFITRCARGAASSF